MIRHVKDLKHRDNYLSDPKVVEIPLTHKNLKAKKEKSKMDIQLEIEELSNKIDTVSQKVDKMYQLMIGHELDEDSGYVSKIKALEHQVQDLVEFKKKIIWIGVGVSAPTALGVFKIAEYFVNFIK